jgi:hypothetical protein
MTINILLILTIFLNILIGFFVLLQNPSSLFNRLFSYICFIAAIWSFANYMLVLSNSLFWLNSTYSLGSLLISTGFIWMILLTEDQITTKNIVWVYLVALFFCIVPFFPNYFIQSYHPNSLVIRNGQINIGMILYSIYYFLFASLIFFKLFISYKKSKVELKRKQIKLILIGAVCTLTIMAVTSMILPFFSYFTFPGFDNFGFLVFITFITYTIYRHNLFNIKILTAHLFILCLWVTSFSLIFISTNNHTQVLYIIVFLLVFIFGIIYLQNILSSIRQRERIRELSQELMHAYEVIRSLDIGPK